MTEEERAKLLQSIRRLGMNHTSRAIGISRESTARAAAGLLVRRGTTELIRLGLPHLAGQ